MSGSKTDFERFLEQEMQKLKGDYFPVKTNYLQRVLTRKAACKSLHPNPEDVFTDPEIGPNYSIISQYEQQMRENTYSNEPIIVERLHPDGYMIINGHHRWAAALRLGIRELPVQVVNLMHKAEVEEILRNTRHTKRAVFDLDEVILRPADDPFLEPPLPFPGSLRYKERLFRGVPALLHFLEKNGYDIWVFSANYYSIDYVRALFRHYHVELDGIFSAAGKMRSLEERIRNAYEITLNFDQTSVYQTRRGSKELRQADLEYSEGEWSQACMDAVNKLESEAVT